MLGYKTLLITLCVNQNKGRKRRLHMGLILMTTIKYQYRFYLSFLVLKVIGACRAVGVDFLKMSKTLPCITGEQYPGLSPS